MDIADPKYREYLRNLPTGYLLDLLVDSESIDKPSVYWILQERGLTREDIDQAERRRRSTRWPRPHTLWTIARWATLFNALIVTLFNLMGLYRLLHTEHPFRGALLFLLAGSVGFGFIIGYKMTTHVYQGSRTMLYCGFPIPVGYVCLESGDEIQPDSKRSMAGMTVNAMVGVSLAIFPLMFLYIMMD